MTTVTVTLSIPNMESVVDALDLALEGLGGKVYVELEGIKEVIEDAIEEAKDYD